MREIETKDLNVQMKTAAPVRSHSGQLIVDANTQLTQQLISRIQFYNIRYIMIEDDQPTAQTSQPVPQPAKPKFKPKRESQTYSQAVKESQDFQDFQLDFSFRTNDLKSYFDTIIAGKPADHKAIIDSIATMLKPGQTSIEFFDMIHNMRSINDSVYAHCINVALISRMLAKWLKFSYEERDLVTLAGILHDIGKTQIPQEILNKEGKLTDEEFKLLRSHPQKGYELIKSLNIDNRVKKAALQHHERSDGSGYPTGLKGDAIEDYSLIVAIADVYDAMTAARSYRAPLCPFQVIGEFEKEGLQKYNPKFILTFLQKIASTYQNNHVLLSDGRAANIVLLNQQRLSKPLVQLDNGECIDLSRSDLYINRLI